MDVKSFVSNDHWGHDVEDNAYALLRTGDGVVAMLHSSATQWQHRFSLEIALEHGAIILSGLLTSSKSYGAETLTGQYEVNHRKNRPDSKRRGLAGSL